MKYKPQLHHQCLHGECQQILSLAYVEGVQQLKKHKDKIQFAQSIEDNRQLGEGRKGGKLVT